MDLPQWLRILLPMEHTGQPPLDGVSWSAAMILIGIAAGLVAIAEAGFGPRDLETK
ncbi:MAG: hypothetical protein WD313_04885 [Acidimicrobiia bacterium]